MEHFWLIFTAVWFVVLGFVGRHYILKRRAVKRAKANNWPVPGTRRWARALFHNGIISIEELSQFYDTHPEVENDNGSDV